MNAEDEHGQHRAYEKHMFIKCNVMSVLKRRRTYLMLHVLTFISLKLLREVLRGNPSGNVIHQALESFFRTKHTVCPTFLSSTVTPNHSVLKPPHHINVDSNEDSDVHPGDT